MDIIFETNGSTAPFKQWLEAFKEIDESLLIEIDLADDMFVAKSFTPDRTIVKYGKITFEQCNMSVINMLDDEGHIISVSEWLANNSGRVYVGFLHTLGNFIKAVSLYSTEDVHKIIVRFSTVEGGLFQANKVEFKSIKLSMVSPCFKLSEFNMKMANDDVFFNNVAAIQNPISFKVKSSDNSCLIRASEINTKDPKKEIVNFEVNDNEGQLALYARDVTSSTYNQCMSTEVVAGGEESNISAQSPVTRANYIIAIKGDNSEASVITLSKDSVQNGRMKIETGDQMFTTIIANVRV